MLRLKNIVVIGYTGGIGKAFVYVLSHQCPHATLYPFSSTDGYHIDYASEGSITEAEKIGSNIGPIDLIIVTNGMLHSKETMFLLIKNDQVKKRSHTFVN